MVTTGQRILAMAVLLGGSLMAQPGTDTTDQGIVMTTVPITEGDGAQLRSLPFMPHYDGKAGTMHGVKFSDKKIQFLSVDVDSRTNTLYLYDYYLRTIAVGYNYTSDMNITNLKFEQMHAGVSKETCQVAYDWLSQVLYWADISFNWIVAAPGQKALIKNDWWKVIVHEHLSSPDGIAVDPIEGVLFWTDTYVNAKIERSNLDGSNRHTLFDTGFMTPISLEADHLSKRIYWVDYHKQTIESANYIGDESSRISLRHIAHSQLFDIAVFREMLMISDIGRSDGMMYLLNKTNGEDIGALDFSRYGIEEHMYGLAVYSQEHQQLNPEDYCSPLQCQHMCLSKKGGAVCACSDGFNLNDDNKTCNDTGTYHKAVVLSTETEICLVDIRAVASNDYTVTCIFSMLPQSTMTSAPPAVSSSPHAHTTTTDGSGGGSTSTPKLTSHAFTTRSDRTTPTPSPATTVSPNDTITMFDINMADRMIFFATRHTIYRRALTLGIHDSNKEQILSNTRPITGLVYDWIDPNNLYWSDNSTIYVTNVQRMTTETIVSSAGEDTKEVILLPHERKLAWLSGSENAYEVKTVFIDGTGQQTIAQGLKNPIGLTRDQDNKKIYMLDNGMITRVAYNETAPPKKFIGTNGMDIVIYKSYFYVMRTQGTKSYFDTYHRRSLSNVNTGYFNEGLICTDVKILDDTLQPFETSPCHHDNGGCEQICSSVFDGGEKAKLRCTCTLGYTVDPNDASACKSEIVTDNFMLVTDWTHDAIYLIDMIKDELHAVNVDATGTPTGIIYNHQTGKIVFGEMYDTLIYEAYLNGSDAHVLLEIESFAFPNRMDLDETTGNIYYTARFMSHVGIITPRGPYIEILRDVNGMLIDIVLHPGLGRLYVGVQDQPAYIMMANMDGSDSKKIILDGIDNVAIKWPEGIAIDFAANKLYWSDGYYDTISRCELDGSRCEIFYTDTAADIKDIVVDGTYLYYVAWNKPYVTRILLSNNATTKQFAKNAEMGRLETLHVYNSTFPNKQPVSNACKYNNGLGDCSTICLPKGKGRTCACEYGVLLKDDNTTCEDIHQCDVAIGNFSSFPESCHRRVGVVCDYRCVTGFEPTGTNLKVNCTANGWDRQNEDLCKEIVCPSKVIKYGSFDDGCSGTLDDVCSYSCDKYYTPVSTRKTVTCIATRTWSPNLDTLCTEKHCPTTLSNGKLLACTRMIGNSCNYTCDNGYTKPTGIHNVICNEHYNWHTDGISNNACTAVAGCPHTFGKVQMDANCSGLVHSVCGYSCKSPSVHSTNFTTIECKQDGNWDIVEQKLCLEKHCPTTLSNGKLLACTRKIGNSCNYTCDNGYTKPTGIHNVICNEHYNWHTDGISTNACTAVAGCPHTFGKVQMDANCSGLALSVCGYSCKSPLVHNTNFTTIECKQDGNWDVVEQKLCLVKAMGPAAQTTRKNDAVAGLSVGVAVLALVIVAIVVVLFVVKRRMHSRSQNVSVVYSNHNNEGHEIAISNPGYAETGVPMTKDTNTENPYATVDPSQMQPFHFPDYTSSEPYAGVDDGFVNPMYQRTHKNAEPLPEYGTLEITAENAVLTKDSWQEEKAKGPDAVDLKE